MQLFSDQKGSTCTGVGDLTLSTVPIWQPLYIDNRSSALGLNPTPGQGTPICDGSPTTEVCTTIIGVHISHSVQKYTLPGNADALSRLPLTEATEVERQDREDLDDCPEFRLNQLEQIPVTTAVLRDATAKDPVLSRVLEYIQVGWPVDIPEELKSERRTRGGTRLPTMGD